MLYRCLDILIQTIKRVADLLISFIIGNQAVDHDSLENGKNHLTILLDVYSRELISKYINRLTRWSSIRNHWNTRNNPEIIQ